MRAKTRLPVVLGLGLLSQLAFALDEASSGDASEDDKTTTLTLKRTSTITTFVSVSTTPRSLIPESCRACHIEASESVNVGTWTIASSFAEFLHTATFTYTALTIINTVEDTTSYTVIVPDDVLASGFVPPTETNERGTRTAVTTFSHTGSVITTTLAFPTAIMDYPDDVTVKGPINSISPQGDRSCDDGLAIIKVDANPTPGLACEDLDHKTPCLDFDPLGWTYELGSVPKDAGPLMGRLDLNDSASVIVFSCDVTTALPAVVPFDSSWLLVGTHSTSFAGGSKAGATAKPPVPAPQPIVTSSPEPPKPPKPAPPPPPPPSARPQPPPTPPAQTAGGNRPPSSPPAASPPSANKPPTVQPGNDDEPSTPSGGAKAPPPKGAPGAFPDGSKDPNDRGGEPSSSGPDDSDPVDSVPSSGKPSSAPTVDGSRSPTPTVGIVSRADKLGVVVTVPAMTLALALVIPYLI